jgi:tRNA-binding EMAP/Myf-like protein
MVDRINPTPVKKEITTADLEKIDLRFGTILAVPDVPGSEKLVKL